jgi:hypothetical protein
MQMHSPTCNERALLLSSLQTALVLFRPTGKLHGREAAGGLYGREVKPDTYGLCAGVAAHTHTQKSTDMRACRFVEGLEEVGSRRYSLLCGLVVFAVDAPAHYAHERTIRPCRERTAQHTAVLCFVGVIIINFIVSVIIVVIIICSSSSSATNIWSRGLILFSASRRSTIKRLPFAIVGPGPSSA